MAVGVGAGVGVAMAVGKGVGVGVGLAVGTMVGFGGGIADAVGPDVSVGLGVFGTALATASDSGGGLVAVSPVQAATTMVMSKAVRTMNHLPQNRFQLILPLNPG